MTRIQATLDFSELNHDGDLLQSIRTSAVTTTIASAIRDDEDKLAIRAAIISVREPEKQQFGIPARGTTVRPNILVGRHAQI